MLNQNELISNMRDKFWRLNNLYYIKDKNGKVVKFKANREQLDFYENCHNRNIILKARQLGFTTLFCLWILDAALFEHKSCALIAHSLDDANRFFREKVKFAYDRLPDIIKSANPAANDRSGELVFKRGGYIAVSNSFRGGTIDILLISEFGKICAKYPDKAREIVSGAFEAVPKTGMLNIESTSEGASGYFYEYCKSAYENLQKSDKLNILEFKFFFYSWFDNPDYEIENAELSKETIDYFESLNLQDLKDSKKAWYQAKKLVLKDDIKREYPTVWTEAFEVAIDGAYYEKQLSELLEKGRLCELPDNSHLPVITAWDLGVGDSTAIWFIREVNGEFHAIDYYENSGEGLRHYMRVLKEKGYNYSLHLAPHDINNRDLSGDGKSRREIAMEGYEIDGENYCIDFTPVARTSIDDGIEMTREILPKFAFERYNCQQAFGKLQKYRKSWNDKLGVWADKPLHDDTSHCADAMRYFCTYQFKKSRNASFGKFEL